MTRVRAASALATLAMLLIGLAVPLPAAAEFCLPTMPRSAADVTGHTFTARISKVRTEGSGPGWTFLTFDIGRVYASSGDPRVRRGGTLEVYSNACDGIHLMGMRRGDAVLISTGRLDGDGPSTWNSAVWQFTAGLMRLNVIRDDLGEPNWRMDDRRIRGVRTLEQALALVAPNRAAAVIGLPPTDTDPATHARSVVQLVGVVAALAAARRLPIDRRRLARDPPGASRGSR